jgi:hypothetical protein
VKGEEIFDDIKKGIVPECMACKERLEDDSLKPQGLKRKRMSNGTQKSRKKDGEDSSEEEDYEIPTPGVMKVSVNHCGPNGN